VSTVQLRYIGGIEHVDVPILRREGEPLEEHGVGCLVRGEVFTCDKTVAGRVPKLADDGTLEIDPDTGQPVDPGEGLLAQVANFELASKPAAKKPSPTADTNAEA
jgi:hypothetical protein